MLGLIVEVGDSEAGRVEVYLRSVHYLSEPGSSSFVAWSYLRAATCVFCRGNSATPPAETDSFHDDIPSWRNDLTQVLTN